MSTENGQVVKLERRTEQNARHAGKDTEDTPPDWDDLPALAKAEEVAALLRTTKKTFYNLLEKEEIPGARKVGKNWRISVAAFRAWYESGHG